MQLLFILFSLSLSYHRLYNKSIYNVVIYNIQDGCKHCATIENNNLTFRECSTTYLISQRFDIVFRKDSFNYHKIISKLTSLDLTEVLGISNFELILANGRHGFFITSSLNSSCLTNNQLVSMPYIIENTLLFRECKSFSSNKENIIFYFSENQILPYTYYAVKVNLVTSSNEPISDSLLQEIVQYYPNLKLIATSNNLSFDNINLPIKISNDFRLQISESSYRFSYVLCNKSIINEGKFEFITNLEYSTPFYNRQRCEKNQNPNFSLVVTKLRKITFKFKSIFDDLFIDSIKLIHPQDIIFNNITDQRVFTYSLINVVKEFTLDLSFGNYNVDILLIEDSLLDIKKSSSLTFSIDECSVGKIVFFSIIEKSKLVTFKLNDFSDDLIFYDTSIIMNIVTFKNLSNMKDYNYSKSINNNNEFSYLLKYGEYQVSIQFNSSFYTLKTTSILINNDNEIIFLKISKNIVPLTYKFKLIKNNIEMNIVNSIFLPVSFIDKNTAVQTNSSANDTINNTFSAVLQPKEYVVYVKFKNIEEILVNTSVIISELNMVIIQLNCKERIKSVITSASFTGSFVNLKNLGTFGCPDGYGITYISFVTGISLKIKCAELPNYNYSLSQNQSSNQITNDGSSPCTLYFDRHHLDCGTKGILKNFKFIETTVKDQWNKNMVRFDFECYSFNQNLVVTINEGAKKSFSCSLSALAGFNSVEGSYIQKYNLRNIDNTFWAIRTTNALFK